MIMNVQDFIKLCDSLPLDKDDVNNEARANLDVCNKGDEGAITTVWFMLR